MTDLDELERLLKAATAGPWISDDGIVTSDTREIHNKPPFVRGGACVMVTPVLRDQDADLIAALRNCAEELIRDARACAEIRRIIALGVDDARVGRIARRAIAQEGKG